VLIDVRVDAASIGIHRIMGFALKCEGFAIGSRADAKRAELRVYFYDVGPENFRELATTDAAEQIHLPETVLRHYVALCFDQISEAGCANMRDAPDVAFDSYVGFESGKGKRAVNLRERPVNEPPKAEAAEK